jgi:ABC-2 type transport system ATP-binding protein
VSVNGLDIEVDNLEIKKQIGYLPENNPLYPEMYVREYLGFVASIYNSGISGKKLTDNIIELTGLAPEQNKKIGSLSKGYRQRVGLAQALINNPAVLILDEATSGLDPNQIVEIGKNSDALNTHNAGGRGYMRQDNYNRQGCDCG